MKNKVIRSITSNGIVIALYFLLTLATSSFSFGMIQVRVAEILVLLCFFRRDYIIGVTLGCLVANIMSPIPLDILFGTLATLASCVIVSFCRHLLISTLSPVLVNGVVVGLELVYLFESEESFWVNAAYVALGEIIAVTVIGYILFFHLGKKKFFQDLIGAERCLDFKW